MGTIERRNAIMRCLYRRRHDTIGNLASEFGVSSKTIQRDIEQLSLTEPIYTMCGRHGGGVYIMDEKTGHEEPAREQEAEVLAKLLYLLELRQGAGLSQEEMNVFRRVVRNYTSKQKF